MGRKASAQTTTRKGLTFSRYFTKAKVSPYDEIEWELRTASIGNEKGKMIFEAAVNGLIEVIDDLRKWRIPERSDQHTGPVQSQIKW